MKERVKNIFKGLGYAAIFMGTNYLVSIIAILAFNFIIGFESAATGVALTVEESTAKLMEYVLEYTMPLTIAFQLLSLLLVWLICLCRRRKLKTEANLVAFNKGSILPITVLAIMMSLFIGTFMVLVLPEDMMEAYNATAQATLGGPSVLQFISAVILAPIVEEIIFRGFVLPRFAKAMPLTLAVVLSSVTFGLIHNMQIVWICYATVLGLLMAFIAIHEKSVLASILFHVVFNLFGSYITGYIPLEGIGMVIACVATFAVSTALVIYMIKQKKAAIA